MRNRLEINRKDALSALFLLAFSIFICFTSLSTLSYGHFHLPGPAFLPFWSGVLMGAMSLGLLVKSIMQAKEAVQISFRGWSGKPLYILLALIAYGLLFGIIGSFFCNLFFMIGMILLFKGKRWFLAIGGGLVTALGFHLVFSFWLNVPLPRGILGIF